MLPFHAFLPVIDLTALQQHCRGAMAQPGDPDYHSMVTGNLWSQLLPERWPDLVMRFIARLDESPAFRRGQVATGDLVLMTQLLLRHQAWRPNP